jgi:tRNA nucleotidyltransferase/poly(A) polymerase
VRRLQAVRWPDGLLGALARLAEDGHAAWLVGGTVRDALLERPAGAAWDVATDRLPDDVIARFQRVVPIGLAHGTVQGVVSNSTVGCAK